MITKFPIGSCAHKRKFKEKLFNHAEQNILAQVVKFRRKQIDIVRFMTNKNVPYEKRNHYVDFNIESCMNLLNNKDTIDKDS